MLLILNRLLLFNSFTREILSHYIQYIQRKDKILFWVCQFNASITDLFVAWLCSKWDRFPAHYRSLVYCELRLGILGQLHPVDQVLHHKQAWNIQTSCLFQRSDIRNCEGIDIASPWMNLRHKMTNICNIFLCCPHACKHTSVCFVWLSCWPFSGENMNNECKTKIFHCSPVFEL